ncbi:MAG: hydroxypyruvate isomerase [Zoogloea sp.]|nr:hydroxypyruvate isomerase [Zoogloea sp.]
MPRFCANLSLLFTEHDFLDRFEAAAQAGFEAVEFQFPYAWKKDDIAGRVSRHGLQVILHNLPAGDWAGGSRGIAALPGREAEFRDGVRLAVEYAKALGCRQLNCLAGVPPVDADPDEVRRSFAANLRFAAAALAEAGIRLLVEPINTFDVPGFHLCRPRQALELIAELGVDNLYLQYDVYHAQRMEGELANTLAAKLGRIAHIQIADTPGRHEPGTGEINYPFLFRHLDEIGYTGWVGCEYLPAGSTLDGLGWLAR